MQGAPLSEKRVNTVWPILRPAARLPLALLLSAAVHLTVLLGVHFTVPYPEKQAHTAPPLEIVLVNSKSATKPVSARALAQANLDGGGTTDSERDAKSPLPALDAPRPDAALQRQSARRVKQLEQQAQQLMTQLRATASTAAEPGKPQPDSPPAPAPDAADLVQQSLNAARLEARISREWDNYQKRPRRTFIGARTREYRLARYVEDWRLKVERVGNLNYPQAARQQKLYGSLQLTVSIKADGSVESVEVNHSSGHKLLDAAAVQIVQLAAPFAPLPEDIRRDTDILSITRTWQFTRADQLLSE